MREIASSRWEIDIDASMKVDSSVRSEINHDGREDFVQKSGQLGFGINMYTQKNMFVWYKSRKVLLEVWPFVLAPETPESMAAWESGVRQVRLTLPDHPGFIYTLRYEGNDKVSYFRNGGL